MTYHQIILIFFSLSVIEHIPLDELKLFHTDIIQNLRQGDIQLHIYDRPFGGDVLTMKNVIEEIGFKWLEPLPRDIHKFWQLCIQEIATIVFEHPYNVLEHFSFAIPKDKRVLWNWVTVLVGAYK